MKAAFFDLDGTLIDSLADLGEAVNRMLQERGCPIHPVDAYREFIGEGARLLVQRALPPAVAQDADLVNDALAAYQAHYQDCWRDQTRPYPGVVELLAKLQVQGVHLAVISNKPHAFTQLCAEHFFPDADFVCVLGQREGVQRKPDPAAALEAAALCGLSPADCIYVGDSGVDMRFARAAGMTAIGVLWGFRDQAELVEAGATHLVRTVPELEEMLLRRL